MDPDAASSILFALVGATALAACFATLLWAAVQDGRDDLRRLVR